MANLIGIDIWVPTSMNVNLNKFIEKPKSVFTNMQGLAGKTSATLKGTGNWKWQNYNDRIHIEIIPDIYYCASLPFRILCPQQLSQSSSRSKNRGDAIS